MFTTSMPSIESSTPVLRHQEQYLVQRPLRRSFYFTKRTETWPNRQRPTLPVHAYHSAVVERPNSQAVSRYAVASSSGVQKNQSSSSDSLGFQSNFHDFYSVGELIGEGSYGKVHVATCKQTQEQWAVKILPKHRGNRSIEQNLAVIAVEVNAWRSVQGSRHVARLEGVFEDEEKVYIIQELCLGGDLKLFLQEHGPLADLESAQVVKAVLSVIAECHRQGISYGDVKPANFLLKWPYLEDNARDTTAISGRLEVRVVDFGCSQRVGAIRRKSGTPLYMAPEMFQSSHGLPADVWAVGVVMYHLLTGRLPFWDADLDELQTMPPHLIVSGIQYNEIRLGSRFGVDLSADAEDLLRLLLSRSTQYRITAEQALQHPWLQSVPDVQSDPLLKTAFHSSTSSTSFSGSKLYRNSSLDSSLGSQIDLFDSLPAELDAGENDVSFKVSHSGSSSSPDSPTHSGPSSGSDFGSLQGHGQDLLMSEQESDPDCQDEFLMKEQNRFSVGSEGNPLTRKPANNVVRLPCTFRKWTPGTTSFSAALSAREK